MVWEDKSYYTSLDFPNPCQCHKYVSDSNITLCRIIRFLTTFIVYVFQSCFSLIRFLFDELRKLPQVQHHCFHNFFIYMKKNKKHFYINHIQFVSHEPHTPLLLSSTAYSTFINNLPQLWDHLQG